ncbi:MAG: transglycosylase [Chromatiales bacterium 21-64-14]|nr:MAG: transglycosylase [Chromatiales bacterium 21-64-14]HQU14794.1 transglycosylase SLT domain-containing protein [Gammaproteobacteria bacterium]
MMGRSLALLILLLSVIAAPCQGATTGAQRPDPELLAQLRKAIRDPHGFRDRFAAEVWLLDMSGRLRNKVPDPTERLTILKAVHYEATRAGLYPELVLALIQVESNFDRYAISNAGALGLMQVMPFWLKEIGRPNDSLFDIQTNLRLGCTILAYYLKREHGDLRAALARYNGSAGQRQYPDRVLYLLSQRWYMQ